MRLVRSFMKGIKSTKRTRQVQTICKWIVKTGLELFNKITEYRSVKKYSSILT